MLINGRLKIRMDCSRANSYRGNVKASNDLKCEQCLKIFPTLAKKKKHEKLYHLFSKPFICDCGQQFGKVSELNYHKRRIHNEEKNYVCNICEKAFFKNSDLVIHQSVHESFANFICEDCGRRFKHVSNLIRHSRTHSGVKPYLCMPCNKRFSQIAALRQHETTEKHNKKVASETSQTMTEKRGRGKHLSDYETKSKNSKKSSGNTASNRKRKGWFYCKICGERFPFSVLLRNHETMHIINRDIKCNCCKAEFTTIMNFKNHACSKIVKSTKRRRRRKKKKVSAKKNKRKPQSVESLKYVEVVNNVSDKGNSCEEPVKKEDDDQICNDKEKKVELTLTQGGQIILDNDEVLLTLNDKSYGLVLINNDITVVENNQYLQIININSEPDVLGDPSNLSNIETIINIEDIPIEFGRSESDLMKDLSMPENWLLDDDNPEEIVATEFSPAPADSSGLEVAAASADPPGTDAPETPESPAVPEAPEVPAAAEAPLLLASPAASPEEKEEAVNVEELDDEKISLSLFSLTASSKRKYRCSECFKQFDSKRNYSDHLGTHFLKLPKHKCMECDKLFSWHSNLRKHIVQKHGIKTEYSCQQCDKKYFSTALMENHIQRDHLKIRSHICAECGKAFFRRHDLKVHMRVHTDERPYICEICGKRFRHLSHSIRHDKTHTKEEIMEYQRMKQEQNVEC